MERLCTHKVNENSYQLQEYSMHIGTTAKKKFMFKGDYKQKIEVDAKQFVPYVALCPIVTCMYKQCLSFDICLDA